VGFESSSHFFDLSPDVDEGFREFGSRDTGIFKVSKGEIEFVAHEGVCIFLEIS